MKYLFFVFIISLISCNQNTRTGNDGTDTIQDEEEVMIQGQDQTNQMNQADSPEEFISTAASSGMMEVQLGQIAAEKATSQQVKDFGQMMVQDHTNANNKLKEVAATSNVNVPQNLKEEHQQNVDRLQNLSGNEFDQEYMNMMVQAHQQDVTKFQQAQDQFEQTELNNWINETLPVLEQHLQQAQQINQSLQGTAQN